MLKLLASRYSNLSECEDGRDALEAVVASMRTGQPFDFVLMDYQMPVMDGPTAAIAMRAAEYQVQCLATLFSALRLSYIIFLSLLLRFPLTLIRV